jgi:hypothetical protein
MTYLAQVIRPAPCCGSTKCIGRVLEVIRTETPSMLLLCTICFSPIPDGSSCVVTPKGEYMLTSRVKRLPPPEEEPINLAVSEEVEA